MENTLSLITQFPATKDSLKSFIDRAKSEIESGIYDAKEVLMFLKSMEKVLEGLKPSLKSVIKKELFEKYKENVICYHGIEITKKTKRSYDYTTCFDTVLNNLEKQQAQISEMIEQRKMILKSGIEASTGETLMKPVESTIEYIEVRFK